MVALLISAAVAALAALLGTKVLIGWLGRRAVGQPILSTSEGGPGHEAKAGTPTMGGIAIVGAACVGYAVAHLRSGVIFTRTGLFVMLAMIGAGSSASSTTGSRCATRATSASTSGRR